MDPEKPLSRGARKRLRRHYQQQAGQCQLSSSNHSIPQQQEENSQNLDQSLNFEVVAETAEDIRQRLGAEVEALWWSWVGEVQRCSRSLKSEGCWQFYERTKKAAIGWGLDAQLRALVFSAAANFADPRMARLTQRYSRNG
jgi:hypothetical protein